ncbi:MAG: DNA-binding protein WhiA [Actinomycetota bacterium]|nr:DNA-binding protein WhiA [Actinomycetota bacterium]
MSLSEDVRGELAAIEPRRACCRLAELSAIVRTAGSIHLRGAGRIALHLEVSSHGVARRAFSLLRAYGVSCEIRTFRQHAFAQATRFQLHLEDEGRAFQVLNEAGVLGAGLAPVDRPPRRIVARSCCRAAYLRGAFLGAGSVTGPREAHFELRTSDVESARFLAGLASADGLSLAVAERRGQGLAYAKAGETIAELLAFLGAQDAALRLGESAVVAATRARANRLANADHANIARVSRAADAQLRAIDRLRREGRLDDVSPEIREMAELRARYPTLSLRELAGRARPPATKATAQRRLAKLQRFADL